METSATGLCNAIPVTPLPATRPFRVRHAALALVLLAAAARGQIVLKPAAGDAALLKPKTVDVHATVRSGVAATRWTYTFANDARWRGQADFLIAIPKGGVVGGFAYWYKGERVVARVTEKARAARIYAAIVRRQRDPALIELVGKSTFRVRIFPIEPDADLKVEVAMVQALPAVPTGATLSIPLRALGKLERATVEIEGPEGIRTSWGGPRYEIANARADDLRVTESWAPQALHASFLAARSGGEGGFFSLVLTAPRRLSSHRTKLTGPVQDVMELPSDDGSVHLVGRYRKGDSLRATLMGSGPAGKYLATVALTPPDAVDPNGPATKLWAWARLGRSKDPKEIVALSLRYGVPSRLTSWIAIPTEERQRMAREIAQSELQNDVARALHRLRKVGFRSPEGRRTLTTLEARARSLGISLQEGWSPAIQEETQRAGDSWAHLVEKRGERAPATRAAERELDGLRRLGGDYSMDDYYMPRARTMARLVLEDRLNGRHDAAATVRERELARLARRTSAYVRSSRESPSRWLLQEGLNEVAPPLVAKVAQAERAGVEAPEVLSQLRRVAPIGGVPAEEMVRQGRIALAQEELERLKEPVERALRSDIVDEAALEAAAPTRRLEAGRLRADRAEAYYTNAVFSNYAQSIAWEAGGGKTTFAELDVALAHIRQVADASGLGAALDWNEILRSTYWTYRQRRDDAQAQARRDPKEVATSETLLGRVEAKVDPNTVHEYQGVGLGYNRTAALRNAYVEARHRGRSGEAELRRLVAEDSKPEYAYSGGWENHPSVNAPSRALARAGLLQALTELDDLDRQSPDPQVLARKAELETRANELRARMGDPIVRIDAPNAKSVVARLPHGTWLALHRAPDGRWEGRFDVPPGAKDGRYEILVVVDGELRERVPITVDTRVPKVAVTWIGERAEIATDADVRRVAGFTPDGRRIELTPEAPGRFAALAPSGTRFVATDGAHNRSDAEENSPAWRGSPDPRALSAGAESGWNGGVTALARVGSRLWVGTANEGGAYKGEPSDPQRPWIKAAVDVGGRLAVRYADGTVTLDGTAIERSRRSTALAADGTKLLVGTIGGFYDGDRPVFPPELAGVVVTALLGDGPRVWLGTQGRGIAEVDRRSGRLVWHDERAGLGDDWITCLGRDGRGRVVAGTFVAGAFTLDGAWRPVVGTQGTCVSGVGGGWVATRQGLYFEGRLVEGSEATALLVERGAAAVGTRSGVHFAKRP